eukprot:Gregarina_sp_Poly_1__1621@NODE_140_length_13084_cov_215_910194_g125_i0_p5_GENE_NODE_140_length_13084_cov_215_910194_g125_i0NODE_140_length_13084_cov_215_910194_g125_i0_p5_ORF_typecomplete_len326_score34_64_NODE_140_length_13084_cov_215_910194_g125_i01024411221
MKRKSWLIIPDSVRRRHDELSEAGSEPTTDRFREGPRRLSGPPCGIDEFPPIRQPDMADTIESICFLRGVSELEYLKDMLKYKHETRLRHLFFEMTGQAQWTYSAHENRGTLKETSNSSSSEQETRRDVLRETRRSARPETNTPRQQKTERRSIRDTPTTQTAHTRTSHGADSGGWTLRQFPNSLLAQSDPRTYLTPEAALNETTTNATLGSPLHTGYVVTGVPVNVGSRMQNSPSGLPHTSASRPASSSVETSPTDSAQPPNAQPRAGQPQAHTPDAFSPLNSPFVITPPGPKLADSFLGEVEQRAASLTFQIAQFASENEHSG